VCWGCVPNPKWQWEDDQGLWVRNELVTHCQMVAMIAQFGLPKQVNFSEMWRMDWGLTSHWSQKSWQTTVDIKCTHMY
jgi:hypothetical protein